MTAEVVLSCQMQMSLIADVVTAVVDTAVTCLSVDVSLSVANVLIYKSTD